ncbi:MAG: tetraacyldisaccharide 4'-kinase [Acidobacteriota bacterium]
MIAKDQKLKRALLWLPAKVYELGVRLRVAAYETEYFKEKRVGATVISIGNITLGGVGKTPMVEFIARYLKSEGHEVAILTRGYGRRSRGMQVLNDPRGGRSSAQGSHREFGDEPLMLARVLPDVPVIVGSDRSESGRWAEKELNTDVLILDDAYQHLGLARDLNVVLIDATDPFGGFEMAPFGRLREPLYGLKRADLVIITRADRPFDQAQTNAIIKHFCGAQVPVMYVYSSITGLRHLASGERYELREFSGWNVALMCAIGNPHAFADDILQTGMNIVSENFFRDHHVFTQQDFDRVLQAARDLGADAIVTTEKDAVRLEGLALGEFPLYAAPLKIESEDEVRLKSLLLRMVSEAETKRRRSIEK